MKIRTEKKRMWKTRTSFYLLSIGILLVLTGLLYFTMYKKISTTAYQKEEQTINIFTNQIEGTLDSICSSVNTDLSEFIEDERIQKILYEETASGGDYNYIRNELTKTIAFNSYNAFVKINLYTNDKKCLYPENGESLDQILDENKMEAVENYNGNTTWLNSDEKTGQIITGKKILLSSHSYEPAGYMIAFINMDIMNFITRDYAPFKEAEILLSNEFGEIALKESTVENAKSKEMERFESKLSVPGFWVSFGVPKSVLLQGVSDTQNIMFRSLAFMAVIFLALSYILSVYITYPFKDLIEMMKQSDGKLPINHKTYFNYEANQFNEYYNRLVRKNQELIHDIYEKDIQMLQTQLEMLQTQINPHFLYNTLESVYLTLEAKGEKESANIIYLLSKLFKYALKANKTIALSKELEMVNRYLEIEKYRFGDRFDWEINVDREVKNIKIPKLLLQPLAENAVKHGVEPIEGNCEIQISITAYQNLMLIIVSDNGAGLSEEQIEEINKNLKKPADREKHMGSIGLQNVYRRLKNYYGEDAKLEIEITEDGYTEITLVIPDYKKLGIEEEKNGISYSDSRR